ncbi:MAG: polysaccharide biosynthesis C-terminal domain-containing protein [Reichenbachiella sp.]
MGTNSKIFKSTLIVTAIGGLAQIIGFLVPVLIAKYFGTEKSVDAYYFAISIPTILVGMIIGGAIKIVFIPVFVKEKKSAPEELERLTAQILTFLLILSLGFTIILIAYVQYFGLSFFQDPATQILAENYLIYSSPIIVLSVIFQFLNAIYNANQKFSLLEFTSILKFSLVLLFIYFLKDQYGIYSAIYGHIIGQFLALVVSFVLVTKKLNHRIYLRLTFDRKLLRLLHDSSLAIGAFFFAQLNSVSQKVIASLLAVGSLASLGYAERLSIIPSFVIGAGFSVILTAYWSDLHASSKSEDLADSVNKTISSVLMLIMPIAVGGALLSQLVVSVVFERGSFDYASVKITAQIFGIFILQVIPSQLNNVLSRILHVNQALKYLFVFSLLAFVLNTVLIYIFSITYQMGIIGIPTGLLVGRTISLSVNLYYVNRNFVQIQFVQNFVKLIKVFIALTVMVISIYVSYHLQIDTVLIPLGLLVLFITMGGFIYILTLKLLGHNELNLLIKLVEHKLSLRK